jgi:hypothetical protein
MFIVLEKVIKTQELERGDAVVELLTNLCPKRNGLFSKLCYEIYD